MSESMRRIYVEKKKEYAVEAAGLLADLVGTLGMTQLTGLRIVNRYDIAGLSDEDYEAAKRVVLSEPPVDTVHDETLEIPEGVKSFAIELLPGQYDQREDFAAQCVQLISQGKRPAVAAAKVILLEGNLTDADVEKIKKYTINCRSPGSLHTKPDSLEMSWEAPKPVAIIKASRSFPRKNSISSLRNRNWP